MKIHPLNIYFLPLVILLPILTILGWNLDDSCNWLYRLKYEPFSFFNSLGGRYAPLNGFSQQIISYLTFSPIFFFLYNYITGYISILILIKIIKNISYNLRYIALSILFVPGFYITFYSFFAGEPTLILFWCILLINLYNIFIKNIPFSKKNFFVILIASNIALYHKEPGFIILIVFTTSYTIFHLVNKKKRVFFSDFFSYKWLVLSTLFLSSLIYILQYLLFSIRSFKTGYLSALTPDWSFASRLYYSFKALILYMLSDPIITLLIPLFFVISFLLRREIKYSSNSIYHKRLSLFFSCLSFSVIFYLGFFIILGIHAQHYLLPVYPFALISLAGYICAFLPKIKNILKKKLFFIPTFIITLLIFNSAISSMNIGIQQKISSQNFMNYISALVKKLENIYLIEGRFVNIYIPGKKDIGVSSYRHKYILEFYGLNTEKIKFKYNNDNLNWVIQDQKKSSQEKIKKGDIFLITPNSSITQDATIENLKNLKLKKIIKTHSPNYFEIPEIRHLLKLILLKNNPDLLVHQMIYREVDFGIYEVF